jgi:gamma-glutamyltranspeptidase / glutathione hydrolase
MESLCRTQAPEREGVMMSEHAKARREVVMGSNGMVATAHPLATAAGLDVLQRGGNAMDAAVAAALTTGVVLPAMCGLGGDAFFLHYDAATGKVSALSGSGVAPARATKEFFIDRGYEKMPLFGPLSVSVPGAVSAYFNGLEKFGSMPARTLFRAAIRYAGEGFPITHNGSRTIAASADRLREYPTSANVFLPGGEVPRPGMMFQQPDLARSLQTIAESGPDVFYKGEIAQEIGRFMTGNDGILTADDLRDHQSELLDPLSTDYRGFTIYQTNLPSQGLIHLEEMNILAHSDLPRMSHNSANAIHLMVEAKKRAFADRIKYAGDPRFIDVPLDQLLSSEFAKERYDSIDMKQASSEFAAGKLGEAVGDTTYLCVVDRDGNAVSFIHSISHGWGSGVVAGDTGIVLNNRLGRGFTLEADHPNVIRPGKRTMSTIHCYLVTENGRLRWVGGTPGGDLQPQVNMQILTNLIDFGMNVQEAAEAPRWSSFPGTDPANLPNDFVLRVEDRVDKKVISELTKRGHEVEILGPWNAGGQVQLIEVNPENGVLMGATDPRTEGVVLGH